MDISIIADLVNGIRDFLKEWIFLIALVPFWPKFWSFIGNAIEKYLVTRIMPHLVKQMAQYAEPIGTVVKHEEHYHGERSFEVDRNADA